MIVQRTAIIRFLLVHTSLIFRLLNWFFLFLSYHINDYGKCRKLNSLISDGVFSMNFFLLIDTCSKHDKLIIFKMIMRLSLCFSCKIDRIDKFQNVLFPTNLLISKCQFNLKCQHFWQLFEYTNYQLNLTNKLSKLNSVVFSFVRFYIQIKSKSNFQCSRS